MLKPRDTFTRYHQKVSATELESLHDKVTREPDNLALLDWAAFAFYSAGKHQVAVELYQKLIDRRPDEASYHYYLGNALYQGGDASRARVQWERTMAIDGKGDFGSRARLKLERTKLGRVAS